MYLGPLLSKELDYGLLKGLKKLPQINTEILLVGTNYTPLMIGSTYLPSWILFIIEPFATMKGGDPRQQRIIQSTLLSSSSDHA